MEKYERKELPVASWMAAGIGLTLVIGYFLLIGALVYASLRLE